MNDNTVKTDTTVVTTSIAQYALFDSFPKELRQAIAHSNKDYVCEPFVAMLRLKKIPAHIIIQRIHRVDAEERLELPDIGPTQ